MKRDWNMVRHVLMESESIHEGSVRKWDISNKVSREHAIMLIKSGHVIGDVEDPFPNEQVFVRGLGMKGADLLALIQPDDVWEFVQNHIAKHGGATEEMVRHWAKQAPRAWPEGVDPIIAL